MTPHFCTWPPFECFASVVAASPAWSQLRQLIGLIFASLVAASPARSQLRQLDSRITNSFRASST
ncbi:hypothetical protein MJO29_003574 [Puccinia striiformis f. sp. tritici]|nr:hypothetical protein MJO29_003574 [Puccinia striiformis f. sp. tritici]